MTIQRGQLRRLGHVQEWEKKDWLENIRSKRRQKREKRKTEKRGKKLEGHMKQKEENESMQGKCAKIEKSGNNYGGETHETQLRITLHLTVT